MSAVTGRELLKGAIDLHVHSYPDLMPRAVDDLSLARLARDAGMRGFVLKSHYAPTAERAWLTNQVVPEIQAFGAIVLNHFVGGMNAVAVDVFAKAGGRVVFMPTSDTANESRVLDEWPTDRPLPPYLQIKKEHAESGLLKEPISLTDADGQVTQECRDVLSVVARNDLVLATGHVSPSEALAVVKEASAMGVGRIVATHPDSPHIDTPTAVQRQMIEHGAVMERCFAYLADPTLEKQAFDAIRATGYRNNVLSSDLGMLSREDPVSGLAAFVDRSLECGFSREQVEFMTCEAPARLLVLG
jgi:hypothetical protein